MQLVSKFSLKIELQRVHPQYADVLYVVIRLCKNVGVDSCL